MKHIGIFGGTFNPVHCGHIDLAQWLVDKRFFDEVWLTLSPANPLKDNRLGATDDDCKQMLSLACEGRVGIRPCFIEFELPRPSYTVTTLRRLSELYPDCRFSLIIGTDNWQIFSRWREPDVICSNYGVIIYPRPGYDAPKDLPEGVRFVTDAPVCDISSSEIREGLRRELLPTPVLDYINEHNLYD